MGYPCRQGLPAKAFWQSRGYARVAEDHQLKSPVGAGPVPCPAVIAKLKLCGLFPALRHTILPVGVRASLGSTYGGRGGWPSYLSFEPSPFKAKHRYPVKGPAVRPVPTAAWFGGSLKFFGSAKGDPVSDVGVKRVLSIFPNRMAIPDNAIVRNLGEGILRVCEHQVVASLPLLQPYQHDLRQNGRRSKKPREPCKFAKALLLQNRFGNTSRPGMIERRMNLNLSKGRGRQGASAHTR